MRLLEKDESIPYLFPFSVSSDNSVDDRGFASFCVSVFVADCVYFDILRVINVDELFIYI